MVALFVVLTIVLFLIVDFVVQKIQERRGLFSALFSPEFVPSPKGIPKKFFSLHPQSFILPRGLFFARGHTWAKILTGGTVRVGMDDFIQKTLGKIDEVGLRGEGESLKRGDPLFRIRQGGRELSLPSPIDGSIESVNRILEKRPELLKGDPYTRGWVYTIVPTDLSESIRYLSISDQAANWLRDEVQKLRAFLIDESSALAAAGQTLPDGGVPVEGIIEHLGDEAWRKFQEEFLTTLEVEK